LIAGLQGGYRNPPKLPIAGNSVDLQSRNQ